MIRRYRHFFQILFAIFGVTVAAAIISAQTSGSDADTSVIRKIWANCAAYFEEGDGQSWLSQYDAEGIQLRPDAPARTKQELDAQIPAAFKARVETNDARMSISPIEIVVTGLWAYSRGTYTQDFTDKSTGQITYADGKLLTIFEKQADGSWKIFRDCFNSSVPPK